jgi:hypothetical protein
LVQGWGRSFSALQGLTVAQQRTTGASTEEHRQPCAVPTAWVSLQQTETTSTSSSRGCCHRSLGTLSHHAPGQVFRVTPHSYNAFKTAQGLPEIQGHTCVTILPDLCRLQSSSPEQHPLVADSVITGQDAKTTRASIPTLESSVATESTDVASPHRIQISSNSSLVPFSAVNHRHTSTSQGGGGPADEQAEQAKPRDLWEEAYIRLTTEKSGLVPQYEKILALEECEE